MTLNLNEALSKDDDLETAHILVGDAVEGHVADPKVAAHNLAVAQTLALIDIAVSLRKGSGRPITRYFTRTDEHTAQKVREAEEEEAVRSRELEILIVAGMLDRIGVPLDASAQTADRLANAAGEQVKYDILVGALRHRRSASHPESAG